MCQFSQRPDLSRANSRLCPFGLVQPCGNCRAHTLPPIDKTGQSFIPQGLLAEQAFPSVQHADQSTGVSRPRLSQKVEKEIASRPSIDVFTQLVAPPGDPHLGQKRFAGTQHVPSNAGVQRKSDQPYVAVLRAARERQPHRFGQFVNEIIGHRLCKSDKGNPCQAAALGDLQTER